MKTFVSSSTFYRWEYGQSATESGVSMDYLDRSSSFLRFFLLEMNRLPIRLSTRINHRSTYQLLLKFNPGTTFSGLNREYILAFERFLSEQHLGQNTIAKHLKILRAYINRAIRQGLITHEKHPFDFYQIKQQQTHRVALTLNELSILENTRDQLDKRRQMYLDMFLFSCYTGLRFSDMIRLHRHHFQQEGGYWWLQMRLQKTGVSVRLPLSLLFNGKAVQIFRRYNHSPTPYLFSVSPGAHSSINRFLRQLAGKLPIQKQISFHTARHTCATLLLYQGAQMTTIQRLLGHKSIRTTETYSQILDTTILKDLGQLHQNLRAKGGKKGGLKMVIQVYNYKYTRA